MSPAMAIPTNDIIVVDEDEYQKGVKQLYEKGVSRLPRKYILPPQERPEDVGTNVGVKQNNVQLPVIDFAQLQGPNRAHVLASLANACEEYGFFQVVNHGISDRVISDMIDVGSRFFGQSYEERSKFMSSNMKSPVRYGTSFNQNKDNVFCWRDFLKLMCHPLPEMLPYWPSSPRDFKKETKYLSVMLMEAILESLSAAKTTPLEEEVTKELFESGSQLMVVNCYPPCPEPDLTLGMPPHSDYGFLTLLLQDDVAGLQIQHRDKWVTVDPIPNAFVVNVGDHLEIFSNGRYKSVLHRVLTNQVRNRISVASLHSLPFDYTIKPWSKLIDEQNPKRYRDTDFSTFLQYISSCEPKRKNFLESRKIILESGN
ncbi:Probable 2-oxoglutarate-dependent dioxygenase SLC1 [Linum perenne]